MCLELQQWFNCVVRYITKRLLKMAAIIKEWFFYQWPQNTSNGFAFLNYINTKRLLKIAAISNICVPFVMLFKLDIHYINGRKWKQWIACLLLAASTSYMTIRHLFNKGHFNNVLRNWNWFNIFKMKTYPLFLDINYLFLPACRFTLSIKFKFIPIWPG